MKLHRKPAGSLRKLGPAEVTAWPCVEAVRALGRAVGQGGVVETKPIERSRTETNYPRIRTRIQEYHRLWTLMCHSYRAYGLQLFPRGRERLMFAGNGWVSMPLISRTSKDLKDSSATPPTSLTRLAAYVCATPRHRLSGDLGVVALRRRLAAALMGCTTSHWPEKSIVTVTRQQHGYLDELARDRLKHRVVTVLLFPGL